LDPTTLQQRAQLRLNIGLWVCLSHPAINTVRGVSFRERVASQSVWNESRDSRVTFSKSSSTERAPWGCKFSRPVQVRPKPDTRQASRILHARKPRQQGRAGGVSGTFRGAGAPVSSRLLRRLGYVAQLGLLSSPGQTTILKYCSRAALWVACAKSNACGFVSGRGVPTWNGDHARLAESSRKFALGAYTSLAQRLYTALDTDSHVIARSVGSLRWRRSIAPSGDLASGRHARRCHPCRA
jgi:hypothetical protein